MPITAFPNVARVEVRATLDGQQVENTFKVLYSLGIDQAALDALASLTISTWNTGALTLYSNLVTMREVVCTDLTAGSGLQSTQAFAPGIIGTNGGNALPNNVTFSVKRITGLSGRSNRGRVYWFGMTDAQVTSANQVTNTFKTNVVDFLTSYDNDLTLANFEEVIASGATGNINGVRAYVAADDTLDSQRRRLPGRGR